MIGSDPDAGALILAGSGAFLIYVFEQAWWPGPEDAFNNHERLDWQRRNRLFLAGASAVAAFLFLFATSITRSTTVLPVIALLGSVAALYCLPVLPGGLRLKSIWFLKPILIAAAWAGGTTVLPVLFSDQLLSPSVFFICLYRFLFLLPNTLLADLPDAAGDRRAGLETVATKLTTELPLIAGILAVSVPAVAITGWLFLPVSAILLVDSLIALLYLVLCRPQAASHGPFYRLQLDILVCLPLVAAVFYVYFVDIGV
jgi:4-hydroxybenzoate polyprenyltransferase